MTLAINMPPKAHLKRKSEILETESFKLEISRDNITALKLPICTVSFCIYSMQLKHQEHIHI